MLSEHGLRGYPKTSGSKGIHVNVRIEPRWDFLEVRRAALALAREVERRAPDLATSKWWKEERHGVFVDYNQNARDRTVASCYSVRPTPDARVSCALSWDEVPDVEPGDLRLDTVPERLRTVGDPAADIDEQPGSLDQLLELARRDEEGGPRRRALAAALPQAARRAQARPAEPRPRPADAARPRRRPPARRPAARRADRRAPARLRLQAADRPGPRAGVRRRLSGGRERVAWRVCQAPADIRRGRWAFGLTATAFAWALALVAAAFLVPVYEGQTGGSDGSGSTSATLVGENGLGALLPASLPALVTALVWLALHRKCSHGSRSGGRLASALVGLLAVFCLLAILSIGILVVPVAVLLACAARITPLATS